MTPVQAENLLWAGRRYGDASVAVDREIRAWDFGADRTAMDAALAEKREADADLKRAARAYATKMRRKAPP